MPLPAGLAWEDKGIEMNKKRKRKTEMELRGRMKRESIDKKAQKKCKGNTRR